MFKVIKRSRTSEFRDKFIHRWLRIPYNLYAEEIRSPGKPRATIVLIHGIGYSGKAWDKLLPLLPKDVRIIVVDLLGFGQSPCPSWVKYNATVQARSLAKTLVNLRLSQQSILVGHSMGALVAVAAAQRYGFALRHLVLCSPPFYAPDTQPLDVTQRDKMLRSLYNAVLKHPKELQKLSSMAAKLGLVNKALDLSDEHLSTYLAALEASIINQTSLQDVKKLRLPITIFYGSLDPVVIGLHIKKLAKEKTNVVAKQLIVGHEISGVYLRSLAREIEAIVNS